MDYCYCHRCFVEVFIYLTVINISLFISYHAFVNAGTLKFDLSHRQLLSSKHDFGRLP